jgi:signal transduction histidine kinase/DNA-binding response OmpR family regulator
MADASFAGFCRAIEQAYVAHDDDRQLLERALEVSSRELTEKNQDLQKARTIAETASKAKSSFLANMSHEMRTPLNAIIGYSELILEELSELNHDEIAIELEKIRTSGNHLLGLINNVLDLAKIESGHMEVNLDEFDLAALVKESCTILQSQALKNKNKLVFEVDTAATRIVSDRGKAKQILINLTGNALKFTQQGCVTLRIFEPAPERLAISIRDTGVGMNPEKLKKLFQPFVQAESDTQKKFGGTGLGLAISAKFAELLDAAIAVESEEGKGTVFTLTLNSRVQAEKINQHAAPTYQLRDADIRSDFERRILLIDDDPTAIDLMRRFLGRHGFECISLKSGLHAVEEAIRIQPVAVLLDVFMPGMDGWTTLSRLKENSATADIPVIFTTMTDERSLGLSLGALDYFTKPIDWGRLASVLGSIVPTSGKPLVLLTEADSPTRKGLQTFFENKAWGVVDASSTHAFKKSLRERRFDLVILDCLNPEIDPAECINALRDCALNKATAVLCFSNSSNVLQDTEIIKGSVKVVLTDNQVDSTQIERFINEISTIQRKVLQK